MRANAPVSGLAGRFAYLGNGCTIRRLCASRRRVLDGRFSLSQLRQGQKHWPFRLLQPVQLLLLCTGQTIERSVHVLNSTSLHPQTKKPRCNPGADFSAGAGDHWEWFPGWRTQVTHIVQSGMMSGSRLKTPYSPGAEISAGIIPDHWEGFSR